MTGLARGGRPAFSATFRLADKSLESKGARFDEQTYSPGGEHGLDEGRQNVGKAPDGLLLRGKRLMVILKVVMYLLLAIAVSGCSRQGDESEIPIGLSLNFTGVAGMTADDIRDGALLAIKVINERGGVQGRRLKLLVKDDCNSPEGIMQADRALLAAGCPVIIGHTYSQNTLIAYPVVMAERRILFTPYTATNKLSGKDDFFFRTCVDDSTYGKAFAKLLQRDGAQRVAMLLDAANPSFTEEIYQEVSSRFDGQVLPVRHDFKKEPPWNELVQRLMAGNPDVIILVNEVRSTGIAAQKLRLAGFDGRLYSTLWASSSELFLYGADAVDGMSIVTFIKPSYDTPSYQAFAKAMREEFGRSPSSKNARAYEALEIISQAMAECVEPDNPECIKHQLLHQEFDTILGKVKFDPFGDVIRPVWEIKVQGDGFVLGGRLL